MKGLKGLFQNSCIYIIFKYYFFIFYTFFYWAGESFDEKP